MSKLFAAQDPIEESSEPSSQGQGNAEPFRDRVVRFRIGVVTEVSFEV